MPAAVPGRAVLVRATPALVAVALCWPAVGAAPARAADRPWQWPLTGPHAVSRPFEAPAHRYAPGHRGADLPGLPGEPVRSAGAGRVSYAGLLAGRGVVVVVHGALRTTYEPVTATVGVGYAVSAGDVLGVLEAGHPGCWAPACLHWGLKRGEDYLDPVRLVERGPVRLLPLAGPVGPVPALRSSGQEAGTASVPRAAAAARVVASATSPAASVPPEEPRVLAPGAEHRSPARPGRTPTSLASAAAASLLGAAVVGAALRRRA